jgi:hypothetical protein
MNVARELKQAKQKNQELGHTAAFLIFSIPTF